MLLCLAFLFRPHGRIRFIWVGLFILRLADSYMILTGTIYRYVWGALLDPSVEAMINRVIAMDGRDARVSFSRREW